MMKFLLEIFLLTILFILAIYYAFLLPPKHPTNIPTVPFWVALLPFFQDIDQSDIFHKYIQQPLRRYGAVKLWFGARWNILVHSPSYLAEIFREEDIYQKSGNQKKIPYSVLAEFLGDNIISSHGETWKGYRSVIMPALKNFDTAKIAANAKLLCQILRDEQLRTGKGGVFVQEILQRYSVANCSEVLLEMDLEALKSPDVTIHVLQSAVKREIFKPIFMNFPRLDMFPFPGRRRARQLVRQFKQVLRSALVASYSSASLDGLNRRMLDARESGMWTEKQLLDNLTVLFVASQENPQLCMISTLYLLAKHLEAQEKLYNEIVNHGLDDATASLNINVLQNMPFLTSVIYESLRLFPPINQLINRRASTNIYLGGTIFIPEGTYLGYCCYSTNRDKSAWGPTADDFDPARWGDTPAAIQKHYRMRRARAEFISFHGGRRACLGEKFALLEMRITLVALVREFVWELDPAWVTRMTPAGPLYPRALKLVFREREGRTGPLQMV